MVYECKICGAALEFDESQTVVKCGYCQTMQTLPKEKNEANANLLNRANRLRLKGDFDKAQGVYEKIIEDGSNDSEAHWGVVLCKYGIEYVEDPATHERIPTCHRTQIEPVLTDMDYQSAIANADSKQKEIYEERAKAIDKVQKGILSIVNKEEPYDIFICYKETDENGRRTKDSVLANDIYYQLTQNGYKVFYAAITLEDKLGMEYEPYIFAALNSAKIMLVIGTKEEYFNAVWVKNEWSRYIKLMAKDKGRLLIPCYRDMDAYDLPMEFAHLQAQDMGKIGFIEDLIRGIKKVIKKEEPKKEDTSKKEMEELLRNLQKAMENNEPKKERVVVQASGGEGATSVASLLKRARVFLEDKDFVQAGNYAEKVLDIDAECADAYMVKLLVDMKLPSEGQLSKQGAFFNNNANYIKAVRYASGDRLDEIKGYSESVYARKYDNLVTSMANAEKSQELAAIANAWKELSSYRDSSEKVEECLEKAREAKEKERVAAIEDRYYKLCEQMQIAEKSSDFIAIADGFRNILTHRDSEKKEAECLQKAEIAKDNEIKIENYNNAKSYSNVGTVEAYGKAIELLESYPDWRDTQSLIEEYKIKREEARAAEQEKKKYDEKLKEYDVATKEFNKGTLSSITKARSIFYSLGAVKNSTYWVTKCDQKISEMKAEAKKKQVTKISIIAAILAVIIAVVSIIVISYNKNNEKIDGIRYKKVGETYTVADYTVWEGGVAEIKETVNGLPVTSIRKKAFDSTDVTEVTIPASVTTISERSFWYCDKLTKVTIKDAGQALSIGELAFFACESLTTLTLPSGVNSIGTEAFDYCHIESATIPTVAISAIRKDHLKTVIINGGDTIGANGISSFAGYKALESVTIGNSVKEIGLSAFEDCSNLKAVNVTDLTAWCNITFGSYNANPLFFAKNLYINNELVTDLLIPEAVTTIKEYTFVNCASLKSVTIPEGVTAISYAAFNGCTGLTKINFNATAMDDMNKTNYAFSGAGKDGEGITVTIGANVTKIPTYLFCPYLDNDKQAPKITSVVFADNAVCQTIGTRAFEKCSSLTSVVIPASVTAINDLAFKDCSKLTTITFQGTKEQWNAITKGEQWQYHTGSYTVKCTDGDLSAAESNN